MKFIYFSRFWNFPFQNECAKKKFIQKRKFKYIYIWTWALTPSTTNALHKQLSWHLQSLTLSLFCYSLSFSAATNSETDKNENDLNSSNQPQEEVTKEKPRAKKQQSDEAAEEKKSQESVAAPRELVSILVISQCHHNNAPNKCSGVLAIVWEDEEDGPEHFLWYNFARHPEAERVAAAREAEETPRRHRRARNWRLRWGEARRVVKELSCSTHSFLLSNIDEYKYDTEFSKQAQTMLESIFLCWQRRNCWI